MKYKTCRQGEAPSVEPDALDKILILGIGNLGLNDEGIGVHAARALDAMRLPPNVDVAGRALDSQALLDTLRNYRKVILIDAALDGKPAGTIRRHTPPFARESLGVGASETGLKKVFDSLSRLSEPPLIEIIAVSVRNRQRLGENLSPEVRRALPQVLQLVFEIIEDLRTERCLTGAI